LKQFDDLLHNISKLANDLSTAQRQAEALGVFTSERELLECPDCGLLEDVASDGRLITYYKEAGVIGDTGLRFQEVDHVHFCCPCCKCIIEIKDEETNHE